MMKKSLPDAELGGKGLLRRDKPEATIEIKRSIGEVKPSTGVRYHSEGVRIAHIA